MLREIHFQQNFVNNGRKLFRPSFITHGLLLITFNQSFIRHPFSILELEKNKLNFMVVIQFMLTTLMNIVYFRLTFDKQQE